VFEYNGLELLLHSQTIACHGFCLSLRAENVNSL
jgi:hypothetical protein